MRTVTFAIGLATILLGGSLTSRAQSQPANKVTSSIRSVDFLNFTYKPSCTSSRVNTKNGNYDNPDNPQEDVPVHFAVNDVIYGDLRGNGSEEAVVLTGCNLGGTGYWTEAFIFELRAGKAVEVASIGGGDRAMGGIESVRIEGHSLKVAQQYGIAACCADYIESTNYILRENRLAPVGSSNRVASNGKPIKALRFVKGSSSGNISGETGEDAIYEFRAHAGQWLLIEQPHEMVSVGVMDPDGIELKQERDAKVLTMRLPSDGLYTLVVSSNQPSVPYTLKITIR